MFSFCGTLDVVNNILYNVHGRRLATKVSCVDHVDIDGLVDGVPD